MEIHPEFIDTGDATYLIVDLPEEVKALSKLVGEKQENHGKSLHLLANRVFGKESFCYKWVDPRAVMIVGNDDRQKRIALQQGKVKYSIVHQCDVSKKTKRTNENFCDHTEEENGSPPAEYFVRVTSPAKCTLTMHEFDKYIETGKLPPQNANYV